MAEYNGYTKEYVCTKFAEYVDKKFVIGSRAAKHYGVGDAFISLVKKGIKAPNSDMLKDIGFERKNGFVKTKR